MITHPCPHRLLLFVAVFLNASACGGDTVDAEGRSLPDDEQVIADVMPRDRENVVAIETVRSSAGEAYFHPNDSTWYFDRGVVIRRDADVSGVPAAVLVVGGLARYVYNGESYEYLKFLTTYNEYEGIPRPDDDELDEFVAENLTDVFVSREHNVLEVSKSLLIRGEPWIWHSPTSFSAPYLFRYRYRISSTTVEQRENRFDIRFYRESLDSDIHALMATELDANVLAKEEFDARYLDEVKTLRTSFD